LRLLQVMSLDPKALQACQVRLVRLDLKASKA
jgi:hypothetical protein